MTSPSAADRWTAETEQLVVQAIFGHVDHIHSIGTGTVRLTCSCGHYDSGWTISVGDDWEPCMAGFRRHRATAVLTALADAGVLIPVGGETRQEVDQAGFRRGWIERDHAMVVGRCWSCDHETAMHHDPEGCRYSVTLAAADANTVCPCAEFPGRREVTDDDPA